MIQLQPGAPALRLSLIITIPLYGLHTIVLAWVIYRFSKPGLYTLFIAGIIFGLYEAYITKVLWAGWGPDTVWFIGGIAVVETTTLLLFWHPFMAFIIPLFASESILTEVGFISNTSDEKYLKQAKARVAIAEALYKGVEDYFRALGTQPVETTASTQ
jgi:hypothetical protein